MPHNKIWELIAKKLSGEASAEELKELEDLLRTDPDMHYSMQTVADLWQQSIPDAENAELAFAAHFNRMKEMGADIGAPQQNNYPLLPENSTITFRKKSLFLPLLFVLFITSGYFFYIHFFSPVAKPKDVSDNSEVSTKYGSKTKLILPDGTQVWLNSGSKLSYGKSYGNGIREVSLSGEAYFDVVKNPALPFVIHTISIDIKVLGTAFNVKSFPGEKNTETTLIRGSIEVTFKNRPSEKIILNPSEKLITANEEPPKDTVKKMMEAKTIAAAEKQSIKPEPIVMVSHLTYEPVDSTIVETSWMENKMIFRSETFEDLAVRMQRWYGISISFADENIKHKKLTGIFENENFQQALTALQYSTPFAYKIDKKEIIISSK